MNKVFIDNYSDSKKKLFYHRIRTELKPGDLVKPGNSKSVSENNKITGSVYLSPNLDDVIWDAEISDGLELSRVYIVELSGKLKTDRRSAHGFDTQRVSGRSRANGLLHTSRFRSQSILKAVERWLTLSLDFAAVRNSVNKNYELKF